MWRPISFSNSSRFNSNSRRCCSNFLSRRCRAGSGMWGLTLYNDWKFRPVIGKAPCRGGQAASYSHRPGTGQELLHLAEETRRFRMRLLGRQSLELVEQFTLPLGQLLRRLDQNLNVHVAGLFRAQHRHSFTLEAEAAARLRAFRHLHPGIAAVDGRHLEFAPQCRLDHGDGYPAMQIGPFALEERMGAEREENIEVARRTAADASLAFAGEPDAGAVLDAGRNVHGQRALARHPPRTGAGRAGIADHLAAPLAVRAGALQREEALRVQDASLAAGAGTGLGSGAGLRARARAGLAGHRGRDANVRGLSGLGA